MLVLKNRNERTRHILASPFIASVVIPLVFTDVWFEVYHHVCFPLYGIKMVDRKKYIKIDRHRLKYLKPIQKVNCAYCGYANGLVNYWVKIAGETEKYWCGIKHEKDSNFIPPKHHWEFAEYDDEKEFEKKYLSE